MPTENEIFSFYDEIEECMDLIDAAYMAAADIEAPEEKQAMRGLLLFTSRKLRSAYERHDAEKKAPEAA